MANGSLLHFRADKVSEHTFQKLRDRKTSLSVSNNTAINIVKIAQHIQNPRKHRAFGKKYSLLFNGLAY
jgi:hypothetical protein